MMYKTYDAWKKEGYYVMKGEKSHKRNLFGTALFSEEQVDENEYYGSSIDELADYDYDDPIQWDPWMFD